MPSQSDDTRTVTHPAAFGGPATSESDEAPPGAEGAGEGDQHEERDAAGNPDRERSAGRRATDISAASAPEPSAAAAGPAVGTRLSAAEIHENVRLAAEEEMRRPAMELVWSSLAAGLAIGFSFLGAAYLTRWVPPFFRPLAAAAGYPLGFIFVVQARNQLFTENTLEPVIPLLHRRDRQTLLRLLRLWGIVLPGNLVGALIFALVAAHTSVFEEPMRQALTHVAQESTGGGFGVVMYRAIFGGWLIALMAWLVSSTSATGAQILYVWITTAPIAAFGFRHSIAGAAEAFYRATTGGATWAEMIGGFVVPAVLGNIIGGVVLVALLNHGQVTSDPSERHRWVRIAK